MTGHRTKKKETRASASRKNSETELPDPCPAATSSTTDNEAQLPTDINNTPKIDRSEAFAPGAIADVPSLDSLRFENRAITGRPPSARRIPRTLVNGTYRENDPDSLPEPLRQGFIDWANSQKRQPGDDNNPRDEAEIMYNNRTLRFWRLSTDYSRFQPDNFELVPRNGGRGLRSDSESALQAGEDQVYEVVNGVAAEAGPPSQVEPRTLTYFFSPPQRPYTAPPHQLVIRR